MKRRFSGRAGGMFLRFHPKWSQFSSIAHIGDQRFKMGEKNINFFEGTICREKTKYNFIHLSRAYETIPLKKNFYIFFFFFKT